MPASPNPPMKGVGSLALGSTRELHPRLCDVLLRVQTAERTAAGPDRRPTFRLMRELLGAALSLGVTARALSDCLGTSPASVVTRARSSEGLTLSAQLVEQLCDLTPAELSSLSAVPLTTVDDTPETGEHYSTTDFVRTVLALHRAPFGSPAATRRGP